MEPVDLLLQSLQNDIKQVEILSHNLANAQTPGFHANKVFAEYMGTEEGAKLQTMLSAATGKVEKTQRELDVAIVSEGYLMVEQHGESNLTRHGRLHINAEGILTHASGAKVLGESGYITLPEGSIQISESGEIKVSGQIVDKLLTVQPNAPQNMEYLGAGLYKDEGQSVPTQATFQQFALNGSGVESTQDMIKLIEVSRHAQSLQRAMHAIDQVNNAGINELGRRSQ